MARHNLTIEERFWGKVDIQRSDECWPWQAVSAKNGRGYFRVSGKNILAYRLAYELSTGQPIPNGVYVCHTCDNPKCCNPAHLFLGTNSDNMRDMMRKGRRRMDGEHSPAHKLTAQQIVEIREKHKQGMTSAQIAQDYSVTARQIRNIVTGNRWRTS